MSALPQRAPDGRPKPRQAQQGPRFGEVNDPALGANDNTESDSIDESFSKSYGRAGLQPQNLDAANDNRAIRNNASQTAFLEETEARLQKEERAAARRARLPSSRVVAAPMPAPKLGSALVRGSKDAWWLIGVHVWAWLTAQLTLAMASLAFLGLVGGFQGTWLGRVVSTVAGAANSVTSAVGIDFSGLSPVNLFLAVHMMLFGFMLFGLMATMFYYAMRGQNPVFGRGAGVKCATIILVIIGSFIPLANLFPWLLFYVLVMWRYTE